MKYIRTKDGKIIGFDTWKELLVDNNKWLFLEKDDYTCCIAGSYIIKQADTIDKLCDEFVIDNWLEIGKPILCKYHKDKNVLYYIDEHGFNCLYAPDLLKAKCEIKGAIWTDKGLIYVAKMNKEGELELL